MAIHYCYIFERTRNLDLDMSNIYNIKFALDSFGMKSSQIVPIFVRHISKPEFAMRQEFILFITFLIPFSDNIPVRFESSTLLVQFLPLMITGRCLHLVGIPPTNKPHCNAIPIFEGGIFAPFQMNMY